MAAFNFPNSPSTNDLHTENGVTFKWNGTIWKKVGPAYTDTTNLNVTGIGTFAGAVHIAGVLTYEDVKNVDSVGIITARTGLSVTAGDVVIPDKIIHSGDTNTAIRFPAADVIAFETGGTERLRINSDGRIWVNTQTGSSATELLRVENTGSSSTDSRVSIISGSAGQAVLLFGDDQSFNQGQIVYSNTDHSMRFHANAGTERLRIDSSGDVLINQPSEASGRLTIKGTNSNGSTAWAVSDSGKAREGLDITCTTVGDGNFGGAISFGCGGNGRSAIAAVQNGSDDDVNGLAFFTHGSNNGSDNTVERLRIHSSGDVDIKHETTTKFQSTNNTCNLRLQSSASGTANSDGIAIQMDSSRNMYLHLYETGDMIFGTSNLERMRITSAGKITMSQGGTVELQTHMMRVGNRTTSQINAGISTSTGALTLDTTTNNLKYYANSQWSTVKKIGNDGSTQTLAARSAKALMDDGQTTSGVYWLDMHGGYSAGNAKRHYCLQDSSYDGGGWTMLYAMNHGNNFASGSNYTFSLNVGSPTSAGDFTGSNWGYDRRNTFTPAANDQFLIRRSDNNDWRRFVVTAWSPTSNSVSNGWETLNNPAGSGQGHPFYATGQMYDSSGNSVSGYIYFNGCAKGGNCNSGGGDGSGFGNFQAWLYGAGGSSAYGGGYNGQGAGGSPLYWGTSALSQGGSLYLQMFYRKSGTQ